RRVAMPVIWHGNRRSGTRRQEQGYPVTIQTDPLPATGIARPFCRRLSIVSVAAIIAVAVNSDGRCEIVGLHIGPSEAETFWSGFLKSLTRRGLRGVKLVISDAHEGLKTAIRRVFGAAWQRCRVHWMRNTLAHVPKTQQ